MRDRFKFLRRPSKCDATTPRKRKKTSRRLGSDADNLTLDDSLDIKLTQLRKECEKRKRD